MHFQHDISRPVDISNVVTGTERLEDEALERHFRRIMSSSDAARHRRLAELGDTPKP
jgi:hypothetical protein